MGYSHSTIAKQWAEQSRPEGKGFNVFFEAATIYSYGYHFAIARHTTAPDGLPCVLMTTRGYSVSTEKHKGHVWRALDYGLGAYRVFAVPNVLAHTEDEHKRNLAAMRAEIKEERERAARARVHGPSILKRAQRLEDKANAYAEAFNIDES